VTQHLDTKTHKNLTSTIKSNKKVKFDIKKEFSRDLMSSFASTNIPVNKLENKHLRKVISNYLRDVVAGAWLSSTTVRKTFPDIHDSKKKILKDSLKENKLFLLMRPQIVSRDMC
jgi:hypothetical protein